MKYFQLKESNDKKETGLVGPQSMAFPEGESLDFYDSPNSLTVLNNFEFPHENTSFSFELGPKSKVTDIISQAIIPARGLLISKKTKIIIENYLTNLNKIIPVKLLSNKNELEYYWLHFIDNDYNQIDYSQSLFYEGYSENMKIDEISINSYNDLNNKRMNELKMIFGEKIHLNENYKMIFHFLLFSDLHEGIFISEQIKKLFKDYKITGYRLIERDIF